MQAREQLDAGLDGVREAPTDGGELLLIARRPEENERELLERADLDLDLGLIGDDWSQRGNPSSPGGGPDPEAQVTIMGARAAQLIADSDAHDRWALAGDQLYVDLDLGVENLPTGARIGIGGAVLEITAEPHLGCGKFSKRFGVDALKFVNSAVGRELRLRGVNAKVVGPGPIVVGARVGKLG